MKKVETIEEIVDKYSDMVYKLAFSKLFSKQDSEDVVQEVFIKYMKNTKKFKNDEHERNWLLRVTINTCKDLLKSSKKKNTAVLKDDIVFYDKFQIELYDLLKSLKDKEREILQLFYYEDLSIKDISKILKISESNVKVRLNRARNVLRENLEGGDDYEF